MWGMAWHVRVVFLENAAAHEGGFTALDVDILK
jgi:hypothetical protein